MTCPLCLDYVNAQGKCYTQSCPNREIPQSHPGFPPKKRSTQLKKQSANKRKEIKETKDIRKVLRGERCEICNGVGSDDRPISTHEIPAGSHRHKAVYDRRCQLRLCWGCHRDLQSMPYPMQLAFLIDSKIAGINEAVGSQAVSLESVKEAM